ncbi:phage baseplate protein [Secundilactobacillus kimchicus]|uniref:phage baseplate protein n=1 Tax=Secundilactobacillus kimchicus TaxID=528209 RepID=UPI000AAC074C|nr:hypothetical protein [Secundilactobacillus kimchicus]
MSKAQYEKALKTALNYYNKFKNIYNADSKLKDQLAEKYQHATVAEKEKLRKQIFAVQQAMFIASGNMSKYKAKYSAAKKKLAPYKAQESKRKKTIKNKEQSLNNAKKEKPGYWAAGRPLIMPKHPGTTHSYVYIDNSTETESSSTSMTSNSISPGQYVNHYTQMEPTQHQIDGKLGGSLKSMDPDSGIAGLKKQYDMLKRWSENGTEVEVLHGQRPTKSAVLTAVSANFDAPRDNAVSVSVTYQDTKWAKSATTKTSKSGSNGKKSKNKTDSNPKKKGDKSKKGKGPHYTKIQKGQGYWFFHKKYGTAVATLMAWNGWPEGKLPVGKRIRVK